MKKVYVCYSDYDMEGCGHPEEVFLAEFDAIAWVKDGDSSYNMRCYMEVEVK